MDRTLPDYSSLRPSGGKRSGKRERILDLFLRQEGHLSADDLVDLIRRDGQARVFWDETPIDLFFAYDPFHAAAGARRQFVPFSDTTIRILAVEHLVVCKVIFNRPKDWVDIDAILGCGTAVDVAEVLRWVGRIAGDDDRRYERIAAVLTRPAGGSPR